MFTNKAFNIAFLTSLVWHLFCMSTVNIVVLPGKYKMRELTSVSFLGPLLEKTALEILLINKPVAITTSYQHSLKYRHSFEKKEVSPLKDETKDEAKMYISTRAEDSIGKALGKSVCKDKEVPNVVKETKRKYVQLKSSSGILGPVAKREVIYKPTKPKLPSWVTASAPFILELEFSVSAQGEVNEVIPAISCGNPEVDLLAIRYLKSWKFAPLVQDLPDEQKSRIRLIFGE